MNGTAKEVSSQKDLGFLSALIAIIVVVALADLLTGCHHPAKLRDIELKGMYVNGVTETVAIGSGRLTSIPGEREALAAHYEEDTAWLSPSTKTHKLDIFLVGTNAVENSDEIISSICKAFADVAPQVAATHAAKAGGTTALDVVKGGGEVRKEVALAKQEVEKIKASKAEGQKVEAVSAEVEGASAAGTGPVEKLTAAADTGSASPAPSGDSADCAAAADCPDCDTCEDK